MATQITELLTVIGSILTQIVTWMGSITTFIVGDPVMVLGLSFLVIGFVVGLISRLIRR